MKKTLFLLLALLMVGSGFAQKAPQAKLISSSEESIVVDFQLNGYNTIKVNTPQGDQYIVTAPEMGANLEAGSPELPFFPIPAIIGDRAEMTVNVIDAKFTDYENIEIAPSKATSAARSTLTTCLIPMARCISRTLSGRLHKPPLKLPIS